MDFELSRVQVKNVTASSDHASDKRYMVTLPPDIWPTIEEEARTKTIKPGTRIRQIIMDHVRRKERRHK